MVSDGICNRSYVCHPQALPLYQIWLRIYNATINKWLYPSKGLTLLSKLFCGCLIYIYNIVKECFFFSLQNLRSLKRPSLFYSKNSFCTNPILQIYYIYWILREHTIFIWIEFNDLDIGRLTLRLRHFTSRNLHKSLLSLVNFILIMSNKTSIPPEAYQEKITDLVLKSLAISLDCVFSKYRIKTRKGSFC